MSGLAELLPARADRDWRPSDGAELPPWRPVLSRLAQEAGGSCLAARVHRATVDRTPRLAASRAATHRTRLVRGPR
jgi:hypothetical protein